MKKFFALLVVLGAIWSYQLIWGKPFKFNHFIERVMVEKALADPEFITYLGVLDRFPIDFFSGKLTDISYKKNAAYLKSTQRSLAVLHRYNRDKLSLQEKLTYDMMELTLQRVLDEASFGYGSSVNSYAMDATAYPVNQLFGLQNYLPDFMVNIHRIENLKGAKHYIQRLNQWDTKFSNLIQELVLREESGVIPPRFVIEKVLSEIRGFAGRPETENILYTFFEEKIGKLDISNLQREKLKKQALAVIEKKVYPAYNQLIAFLESQKQRATEEAGVWKLPHGDAYYAHCLKVHTTTNYTPDEVHAIGLSEVARIQSEMRKILNELGYQHQSTVEAMETIGKDPRFLYADTDQDRTQIIADFHEIFRKIEGKMKLLFNHFPKGELEIKPIPEYRAKASPLAYYEPGDLTGNRPGVFYANTSDMKNQTKYTMPTLAYHEGVPGHHFQIAIALELKNLPTFRHLASFTAYQEGWALYCEQLASEYGFTQDPYSDLGRLQMELLRASRLVVDTGIHAKRWSREQAIRYMMETLGKRESEVTVEVERYIVLPGQACSYKIGMIKILELREKARQKLGDRFDIRKFHDLVLQNGALPLILLEQQIDQL